MRLIALYESLAGIIYHDTGDCEYSRSGRFFKSAETNGKKNAIVTGVASNTFFEKIPEGGVTFSGAFCDSTSGETMFFGKKVDNDGHI